MKKMNVSQLSHACFPFPANSVLWCLNKLNASREYEMNWPIWLGGKSMKGFEFASGLLKGKRHALL